MQRQWTSLVVIVCIFIGGPAYAQRPNASLKKRINLIPQVVQGTDIDIQSIGQYVVPADEINEFPASIADEHQITFSVSSTTPSGLNLVDMTPTNFYAVRFPAPGPDDVCQTTFKTNVMMLPGGPQENAMIFLRDARREVISVSNEMENTYTISWIGTSYSIKLAAKSDKVIIREYLDEGLVATWSQALELKPHIVYTVEIVMRAAADDPVPSRTIGVNIYENRANASGKPFVERVLHVNFDEIGFSSSTFTQYYAIGAMRSNTRFWNISLSDELLRPSSIDDIGDQFLTFVGI